MSTPYGAIGPNTGYIPSATEGLVVGYSNNPDDYMLLRYCANKPVSRKIGLYQRFNPAVQARLGASPANDARWAPGADRPNGLKNQTEVEFVRYETERYDEAVNCEQTAMEQANWAVEDLSARDIANLAMRRRTWLAEQALEAGLVTEPFDSGQPGSVYQQIYGAGKVGNLLNATTLQPAILALLAHGAIAMQKGTFGTLKPWDFLVKVNPNTAVQLATLPEIQNAFVQSPYAKGLIVGGTDNSADSPIAARNANWFLPVALRGFLIVIEDAMWDPGKPGDDPNPQYIMPDNTLDMLACPGSVAYRQLPMDIDVPGAQERYFPVNWTLAEFMYQDFVAESFPSAKHRRTDSHISYDVQPQVVSSLSGRRFTHLFG